MARTKTFTGCRSCRNRKIKCDGTRPACLRCLKVGKRCPGYTPVFLWVSPNRISTSSQGLGGLDSKFTWKGNTTYSSEELDDLLHRIEEVPEGNETKAMPFAVFSVRPSATNIGRLHSGDRITHRLFHHYTTVVAGMMLPVPDDARNPWKTQYPSMSLTGLSELHGAIFHGIICQAAAHLMHLGCQVEFYQQLIIHHRIRAIRAIRKSIDQNKLEFEPLLASILTLIMAEVYDGSSNEWRQHLAGAWSFALDHLNDHPWDRSEMGRLTMHSLLILKLRTELLTFDFTQQSALSSSWFGQSSLLYSDLGFTVGATAGVIAALAESNSLIARIRAEGHVRCEHRSQVSQITTHLLQETNHRPFSSQPLSILHNTIFAYGTIVYLHRQTLDPPPSHLLAYITPLFLAVRSFLERSPASDSSSGITIWPVFMAAVECYRESELRICRSWLEKLPKSGIGNRKDIKLIVLGVWDERNRRRALLLASGEMKDHKAASDVVVHWQAVMENFNIDPLLV